MAGDRCNLKRGVVSFEKSVENVDGQRSCDSASLRVLAIAERLSDTQRDAWLLSDHNNYSLLLDLLGSGAHRVVEFGNLVVARAWVFPHLVHELNLVVIFVLLELLVIGDVAVCGVC